ncbi:MAG TPA: saccharopine dehydrogenase NADP-binding domain-containing protein [Noviherbaspirillum sp.]|nr:saccharopine dehydrogenase NADP-binding domain-containing protein [Noviherbaspirillum sp.]
MKFDIKHARFRARLVMVGFGSVGQAVLPLLLRHLDIDPEQIVILSAAAEGARIAREYRVAHRVQPLTRENYRALLEPLLGEGDFLLNLSVDVSSSALIALCQRRGALYLDTCIEPWAGGYVDAAQSPSQRSNYALREQALALRSRQNGPTAILTLGANPGLASIFVKQALLKLAADTGAAMPSPRNHAGWAELACRLGIQAIHIAERDTQAAARRKRRDEFVNTWSVDGFIGEGLQPSELGWGTHERHWPADAARHAFGCGAAIYLNRPGAATRVRSWTPLEGAYHGFMITHSESISIADHLTLRESGEVAYRPTVLYAYHPCDDAVLSLHELAGRNWRAQQQRRIIRDDIVSGADELGVLLMGNPGGVYWYGSRLSIAQARELAPYNNATSLQVAAGILAGVVWALRNPHAGIVEPDDLDHEAIMQIARPYLGEVVGAYGDWTPLQDRERLFGENLDRDDPWQFKNVRVM